MSKHEIKIKKSIVHILDNTVQVPVLSDFELSITSDIEVFLEKHINRILEDISCKTVYFKEETNFVKQSCNKLSGDVENFIEISRDVASKLYEIMIKHVNIPSADVAFVLFELDNQLHLGILKLNYQQSYIHFIDENTEGRQNKIIRQVTTLPSENQKIDEAMLINLMDFSIILKEKKYEIDGNKEFYLSRLFLKTTNVLSDKEKIDIIDKASKKIIKKYYNEEPTKVAEVRNVIAESVEKSNSIDLDEIKTKVFFRSPEIQNEYLEEVQKKGIEDKLITVSDNASKKVSNKHRLVTDNDIEIKLPPSYLTNKDMVEFITNPDGSIAIVIKNIRSIKDK